MPAAWPSSRGKEKHPQKGLASFHCFSLVSAVSLVAPGFIPQSRKRDFSADFPPKAASWPCWMHPLPADTLFFSKQQRGVFPEHLISSQGSERDFVCDFGRLSLLLWALVFPGRKPSGTVSTVRSLQSNLKCDMDVTFSCTRRPGWDPSQDLLNNLEISRTMENRRPGKKWKRKPNK